MENWVVGYVFYLNGKPISLPELQKNDYVEGFMDNLMAYGKTKKFNLKTDKVDTIEMETVKVYLKERV